MSDHIITLRRQGASEDLCYITVPGYPMVGDVVKRGSNVWIVVERMWVHGEGLTLVVRPPL